jgi:hypothetical protein
VKIMVGLAVLDLVMLGALAGLAWLLLILAQA